MLGLTKDIYSTTVLKSHIRILGTEYFHSMLLYTPFQRETFESTVHLTAVVDSHFSNNDCTFKWIRAESVSQ